MAERYTRLYALPTSFYAENAPVLIRAGALLREQPVSRRANRRIRQRERDAFLNMALSSELLWAQGIIAAERV